MKHMKILVLSAIMLLFVAGAAQAADVKATGYWWIEGVSRTNWNFNEGKDNHFSIEEKLRTAFTFTANENLRGVLDTQIGTQNWGAGLYQVSAGRTPSNGTTAGTAGLGANSAGAGNIMLRQGFIEYKWPGTLVNIKAGFQIVSLPSAFGGGSPVFDDQVGGLVVSSPLTDNVKILAGYVRPYDANNFGSTASATGEGGTSTDAVFAAVPVSFNGVSITPYAMYVNSGSQTSSANAGATSLSGFAGPNSTSTDGLRGYWGGAAFSMIPENAPLKIMADFNYGKVTYPNYFNATSHGGRSGWMADLAVDYTGLSMMTPEAFFVYSSGEKGKDPNSSNRMPVVALPQNWTIGSFFFGERLELAGSINSASGYTRNTMGYWAGGISLKNITLVDKLSHTFNLLYAKGTNDPEYLKNTLNLSGVSYAGFLTTKDSLWEVDLNNSYKLYDELTLYLNLGYINSSFDLDTWRGATNLSAASLSDIRSANSSGSAYKIGLGLNYFF